MNLQTNQFRFKDRRNKLTNRAIQLNSDANAVKDELTHRSVNLNQITEIQMNLHADQFTCYRLQGYR
jgi:hypothetical protein